MGYLGTCVKKTVKFTMIIIQKIAKYYLSTTKRQLNLTKRQLNMTKSPNFF